jgi:hypothetical protein
MGSTDIDDQATDDAQLRQLLAAVHDEGCHAGRSLLALLEEHAHRWATAVDRHCGLSYGTTAPHDLLREAWMVLDRFGPRVLQADAPWAYLWNAVRNAAAVVAAGSAIGSPALAERDLRRCRDIRPPLRVGDETWRLDQAVASDPTARSDRSHWSAPLERLLDLVVERGGDRSLWADAIDRSLDVMADSRRSYEECNLRRDPYLRSTLGLQPEQVSALAALMIGTRRGDRERQSLLLARHRNRTVTPEHVPGAAERIGQLVRGSRHFAPRTRLVGIHFQLAPARRRLSSVSEPPAPLSRGPGDGDTPGGK